MEVSIITPDTLTVSLTLSSSEAAALLTLLTEGYDWTLVGHNWNPLVMVLSSFTEKAVLTLGTGSPYPFGVRV